MACHVTSSLELDKGGSVIQIEGTKGLPTPSESEHESEKDQRTIGRDQRTNGKHQRKFSLSLAVGRP